MFAFIAAHQADYGVARLCRLYKVSRSGFYAWQSRPQSARSRENRTLLAQIRRIHQHSREIYGSPRVLESLRRQAIFVSKHRVARLMRAHGIRGRVVRVTRRQPGLHRFCQGVENRLRKAAPATAPDQHWAGDITYLKIGARWVYLAVVMDLYSRRVLGWSLGDRRTVALTLRAMRMAITKRHPSPGLLFHTDRGIEYRSFAFSALLTKHGIAPSMNRPGHCTDNATMESFFHTLKTEFIRGRSFTSIQPLRHGLGGYINHFYHRQSMHSGIGYQSPQAYEAHAA